MSVRILNGDALEMLRGMPDTSVHCCVTSPPYWGLRDYGVAGQVGAEESPDLYVSRIATIFQEVRRVLKADGTLWLNLGDTYNNCDKWGGGGVNTGKHTKSPDGEIPSWIAVRRKWKEIPGLKPKDLIGIPWRVAFALQSNGWYLRSDIIWAKPNPMPESITDRPTKSHEYLFLLTRSERYYYDAEAIAEPTVSDHGSGNGFKRDARLSFLDSAGPRGNDKPWKPNGKHAQTDSQAPGRRMVENVAKARAAGADHDSPFGGTRNRRTVWTINTQPYPEAHFAVMPEALVEPCIKAGCPAGGTVLDPFAGSGTVGLVAKRMGCNFIGIELNPEYCAMAEKRLSQGVLDLSVEERSNDGQRVS